MDHSHEARLDWIVIVIAAGVRDALCQGGLDTGSGGDDCLLPVACGFGRWSYAQYSLRKLCKLAGKLSYPLYMTHYAVIYIFGNYYDVHKPDTAHLTLVVSCGVLILVGFAYLVMVFYDIPVRRYLGSRARSYASS